MNGIVCNSIDDVYKEMVKCIRERLNEDPDNADYYEYLLQLPKNVLLKIFEDCYEEV